MTLPKKIVRGQSLRNFPADTFNSMVDGRLEDLRTPETIEDTRKPRDKSPVIVQLVWDGMSDVPAGNTVKIGAAVLDPTVKDFAPFSGLKFHASAFTTDEQILDYAITMNKIIGGGAGAGYGIMPEAYWAKVSVSNLTHTYAKITTAGTLLTSDISGPLRIIWKPGSTGEQWCVLSIAGSGDFFQVVRGVTTGAVLDSDSTFTITSLARLEDHSLLPDDPLTVQNFPSGAHAMGDLIYAIYHPATADWEKIGTSSSSTPPLREFELTATKARGDGTATAKWLAEDGATLVGADISIDDAMLDSHFAGQTAEYLSGEHGFRGQALQMRDLADSPSPDTWRIINMEGYAEFIYCTWYSSGVGHYVSNESADDPWMRREPITVGGAITLADPASLLPASPSSSDKLICRLRNPDTTPPTYDVVGVKGTSGGGSTVWAIITTAANPGNYDAANTDGRATLADATTGVTVKNNYNDTFDVNTIVALNSDHEIVGAGCTPGTP